MLVAVNRAVPMPEFGAIHDNDLLHTRPAALEASRRVAYDSSAPRGKSGAHAHDHKKNRRRRTLAAGEDCRCRRRDRNQSESPDVFRTPGELLGVVSVCDWKIPLGCDG